MTNDTLTVLSKLRALLPPHATAAVREHGLYGHVMDVHAQTLSVPLHVVSNRIGGRCGYWLLPYDGWASLLAYDPAQAMEKLRELIPEPPEQGGP